MASRLLDRIRDGRTDLVLDHMAQRHAATSKDGEGVRLIERWAYYGDVGAVRLLLDRGQSLASLGADFGLNAAAFGTEETIDLLLAAGAAREARDMNGDTPLSWGSWYARPDSILRRLCYGRFSIRPDRKSMQAYLLGMPHAPEGEGAR